MSPLGNGKSTTSDVEEKAPTTTDEVGGNSIEKNDTDDGNSAGNNTDSSDHVVVSPARSPSTVPEAIESNDASDDESFEDALISPTVPPTPSFISVGLKKKAAPLSLKSWSTLAMTLDGRDKITKVLQYATRLLSWWLAGGQHKNAAVRFAALYKSFATSRKAFRMGRSLIEFEKLRSAGLIGLIFWHLKKSLEDNGSPSENSSNEGSPTKQVEYNPSPVRSVGIMSRLSSALAAADAPSTELWKALGNSLKMIGLLGFWAGDNFNFVCSSGALDDYSIPENARLAKRKKWASEASVKANQAYFAGSIAGLLTNAYAWIVFRRDKLRKAEEELQQAARESSEDQDQAMKKLTMLKEQQFSLFLALLKSCCDFIVFSNNPGIDLHQKYRGKKNHEGFHCLCGLTSAATVIYNNFPDAVKK